jgi:periplasmic copper chaperone A
MKFVRTIVAVLCALFWTEARAHVTIEQQSVSVGTVSKLTFRVPHGCGNSSTIKLRVLVPEGVIGVKPMPKSGWAIEVTTGKYDQSHEFFHGLRLSEGTKEITWIGSLPDQYYDEFVLSGFFSTALKPGKKLYFPVVQECEKGLSRWIEIPKDGERKELNEPAPAVTLLPKKR